MRLPLLLLALVMALAGCSGKRPSGRQTQAQPQTGQRVLVRTNMPNVVVTPGVSVVGRVVHVNASARFAVLSYPIGQVPPADKRLSVYRGGLKVGELRVTGPQRDQNTVADITAGEARPGDEVRDL